MEDIHPKSFNGISFSVRPARSDTQSRLRPSPWLLVAGATQFRRCQHRRKRQETRSQKETPKWPDESSRARPRQRRTDGSDGSHPSERVFVNLSSLMGIHLCQLFPIHCPGSSTDSRTARLGGGGGGKELHTSDIVSSEQLAAATENRHPSENR